MLENKQIKEPCKEDWIRQVEEILRRNLSQRQLESRGVWNGAQAH